ncbi:phosphoesterase [Arthrobacter phage BaileyBlu]|uniref:Phosphoesterase n=1 Tax=Arthrobacter phage BaileyBlu TaxID=2910754 RepID=A0AA49BNJ0_9CAUD|nr:phosphoesterase [Arthrobacter phage BaileyBlu]UJQ87174.1 phosphoesterase [Arthrobacter phage BaileyBlu]
MSTSYFHSDWHLNHDFVAGTRGFDSAEEHDEWLIDQINSRVTKRDHLWVLGDVFMGSVSAGLDKVSRIQGVKHLVLGNHDAAHPMHRRGRNHLRRFLDVFDSVQLHAETRLPGGRKVMLSHFPYEGDHTSEDRYAQWRLRDEGAFLVHGHVHDEWFQRGRQINVGVDVLAHGPVPASGLASAIDFIEKGGGV